MREFLAGVICPIRCKPRYEATSLHFVNGVRNWREAKDESGHVYHECDAVAFCGLDLLRVRYYDFTEFQRADAVTDEALAFSRLDMCGGCHNLILKRLKEMQREPGAILRGSTLSVYRRLVELREPRRQEEGCRHEEGAYKHEECRRQSNFSQIDVKKAWAMAQGKCEICAKRLIWEKRGKRGDPYGWFAHHKGGREIPDASKLANLAIVCIDCHDSLFLPFMSQTMPEGSITSELVRMAWEIHRAGDANKPER